MPTREHWNAARFDPNSAAGHYESFFQRANHPTRPIAFWIRYTVFSPKKHPEAAVGELWAMFFDRECGQITAAKSVVPMAQCHFDRERLDARVGRATLNHEALHGAAQTGDRTIGWDLRYSSTEPPLLNFPERFYTGGFPKAKALVGSPNAVYTGKITVAAPEGGDRQVDVDGWVGSQNHNWGSQHTDRYGWGQVAGFDNAPDAFLECGAGKLKLGPVWTPWLTPVVLRLDGHEHRLNRPLQWLQNGGSFDFFNLRFKARGDGIEVAAHFSARREDFVGLVYANPPGGSKICLNSKIARCELTVRRPGTPDCTLLCEHRAALELVTDQADHGVPIADLPAANQPAQPRDINPVDEVH